MTSLTAAPRAHERALAPWRRFLSRHIALVPVFAAAAILVMMIVGAMINFPNFQLPRILSSILLDNAYLLVLAVGMTFVILTGGIATFVQPMCKREMIYDKDLLIKGLAILYRENQEN